MWQPSYVLACLSVDRQAKCGFKCVTLNLSASMSTIYFLHFTHPLLRSRPFLIWHAEPNVKLSHTFHMCTMAIFMLWIANQSFTVKRWNALWPLPLFCLLKPSWQSCARQSSWHHWNATWYIQSNQILLKAIFEMKSFDFHFHKGYNFVRWQGGRKKNLDKKESLMMLWMWEGWGIWIISFPVMKR